MDGLSPCEAGVVQLDDRATASANLKHRNNVIGVMFGLKVEEERGKTEHAEPRRGEDRRLETVRRPLVENASRRPRGCAEVIGQVIKEALDAVRRLERA